MRKTYLLLVVVLQRRLQTLLQPPEHQLHVVVPPDLRSGEGHLGGEVEDPLLSRTVFVRTHGLRQVASHAFLHRLLQMSEPHFHLVRRQSTISNVSKKKKQTLLLFCRITLPAPHSDIGPGRGRIPSPYCTFPLHL